MQAREYTVQSYGGVAMKVRLDSRCAGGQMHSRRNTVQSYGRATIKVRLGQVRRLLGRHLDAGQVVHCSVIWGSCYEGQVRLGQTVTGQAVRCRADGQMQGRRLDAGLRVHCWAIWGNCYEKQIRLGQKAVGQAVRYRASGKSCYDRIIPLCKLILQNIVSRMVLQNTQSRMVLQNILPKMISQNDSAKNVLQTDSVKQNHYALILPNRIILLSFSPKKQQPENLRPIQKVLYIQVSAFWVAFCLGRMTAE